MDKKEQAWTLLGVGISLGFFIAIAVGAKATPEATPSLNADSGQKEANNPSITSDQRQTAVTRAVASVAPSVVSITTEEPTAGLFARYHREREKSGQGSGVIIESEGIVLTNAHVVANSVRISAGFSNGTQGEAVVIGLAEDLDLAVLRVKTDAKLRAVEIGTSGDLILGESVIAIGNPFGLGHTVTTGVVSATSRPLETGSRVFQDFIQTDASINPGNSGGALINTEGQLIGITTAIRPNSEGIGFAIPIDRANKIAQDLLQAGTVQVPFMGVLLEDLRLPSARGAYTRPVVVATTGQLEADHSLQKGDIIETVEGRPILSRADLNAFLAAYPPGAQLRVTILRNSVAQKLAITSSIVGEQTVDQQMKTRLGWTLKDNVLNPDQSVVSVQSIANSGSGAMIGLRQGDLLIGVDGARVPTVNDVKSAIQKALERHRSSILITVRRGRAQGRVLLPL